MKKLTTDTISWTQDAAGGWLRIKCAHPQQVLEDIVEGKSYDVEIKEHRERRSLDANAYAWVLMDKIAAKLGVTKVLVYQGLIKDVPGASETVCVKAEAADKLCRGWEAHGIGWLTDRMPSKLPGCVNVVLHYGSSVYDSAQMHRLIELIVDECKSLGIETLTPEQIAGLEGMAKDG